MSRGSEGALPATPTIKQVLTEFANSRRAVLEASEHYAYRRVLFFLELCINNYGHRNLAPEERAAYERRYHAEGSEQLHFFEIFGPRELLPELAFFTDVYVKTDVFTTERIEAKAPKVVAELAEWLVTRGYVAADELSAARDAAARRLSLRTRTTKAAKLLAERALAVDPALFDEPDFIDSDDHPIARLAPGRLWLHVYRTSEPEEIGPLFAAVAATELLCVGWSLSCRLARVRGRWHLAGIDDVYPRLPIRRYQTSSPEARIVSSRSAGQ